jgi:beta-cyclopiazonate dehydrogenase
MGHLSFSFWRVARAASLAAVVASALAASEQDFAPEDIITRDVCILGGGGSGTYGAVRLKDMGHSVVVVERNDRLGGHAETLYLPDGSYIDYGVEGVFNDQLSRDYFQRLGVDWKSLTLATLDSDYVNFKNGQKVIPPANILATTVAALLYRLSIQEYSYLEEGVYNLPDPVPEELLRPFSEFVETHAIQGALQLIFMFAQNVGDILEAPLLYIIQNFGIPHVNALLEGYITPTNGLYELYGKAADVIGADVLYQTTVTETTRSESGVSVVVQSADGSRKLIKAKKLLISFPPTLDNLKGFDLDETETSLFQKWMYKSYYVAILNNTGIPDNINVVNTDPDNQPGSLPHVPFQWQLQDMGVPGYLTSKLIADGNFTAEDAKDLITADFRRMGAAGTYAIQDPEFVAFGSHSPETLIVSNDDIRNGFYRQLYSLQGQRSTYYTGLTFCTDYSSLLWQYTDTVIQQMFSS